MKCQFADLDEAFLKHEFHMPTQYLKLQDSCGFVLAEQVNATDDCPAWDRAEISGFAISDTQIKNYRIKGIINPGENCPDSIEKNSCFRVFSGSKLPKNTSCVLPLSCCTQTQTEIIIQNIPDSAAILHRSRDLSKGDRVLPPGVAIRPEHTAMLACFGQKLVKVYQKPRVGILSIGSELISHETSPHSFHLRSTNSVMISSILNLHGLKVQDFGIAKDRMDLIQSTILRLCSNVDALILVGGGTGRLRNEIEAMFQANAYSLLSSPCLSQRAYGAIRQNSLILALPGNPVSCFASVHIFALPVLYRVMRCAYKPKIIDASCEKEYIPSLSRSWNWIPVHTTDSGKVYFPDYKGYAHLHSLHGAIGLFYWPPELSRIKKGQKIRVVLT